MSTTAESAGLLDAIGAGPDRDNHPEPVVGNLESVYLDGTLVLIGCGKAKRDPDDPADLHLASVGPDEALRPPGGPTGPAWQAQYLYTSTYFAAKREFAETVTTWAGEPDKNNLGGWAIPWLGEKLQ